MSQFMAYQNTHAKTKTQFPLLLNIQSDLLSNLETIMVIPLTPKDVQNSRHIITYLMPVLNIKGIDYILMTPQMAGIHKKLLGKPIFDCSNDRQTIIAAIDFLTSGF